MAQERRRAPRTSTRLTAIVTNVRTGRVKRLLTKNMSGVGLCVVGDEAFERGTQLDVELALPDRPTPLLFTAEVVWIMTGGDARKKVAGPSMVEMGLTFVKIQPQDQKTLSQYAVIYPLPAA